MRTPVTSTVAARMLSVDKPGAPEQLSVAEMTENTVTLRWAEPSSSGAVAMRTPATSTVAARMLSVDKPGVPEQLSVAEMTENTVTLRWAEPSDDGGCTVKQYVVEKREANKRAWQREGVATDTRYQVTDGTVELLNKCSVRIKSSRHPLQKLLLGETENSILGGGSMAPSPNPSHPLALSFQA